MKKILSTISHYLPGSKSGGPLVSMRNLVDGLMDEYAFNILTTDRDLGDTLPYPNIESGVWNEVGHARVRYLSPNESAFRNLCQTISETDHDLLYLNSFFAPRTTILPLLGRRLGRIPPKPVLLAPRGEFSKGALSLKGRKKRAYLSAAKAIGLLQDVQWHASSELEAEDIARTIGPDAEIFCASDLPDPPPARLPIGPRDGDPQLHVAFLSRISPKKNLDYAIDVLGSIRAPVQFNIYGPEEDRDYWAKCRAKLERLPAHISWTYHGAVVPVEVPAIMRSNDLFFLPTRGENFGHVIAEALSMGTRVLISDQTPWRELAATGLGYDLRLSDPKRFAEVIESLAMEPCNIRLKIRNTVHSTYVGRLHDSVETKRNRKMFQKAMSPS